MQMRVVGVLCMPGYALSSVSAPQVQCLRAYKPRENDELALEKADVVMVTQQSRPRELRAFFSCMAWRAIPGPLSKRKRRLDSLEAAQVSEAP